MSDFGEGGGLFGRFGHHGVERETYVARNPGKSDRGVVGVKGQD